jgi:hypothetical protein
MCNITEKLQEIKQQRKWTKLWTYDAYDRHLSRGRTASTWIAIASILAAILSFLSRPLSEEEGTYIPATFNLELLKLYFVHKWATRPLIREGAPQEQKHRLSSSKKYLEINPRWGAKSRHSEWLTVNSSVNSEHEL